MVRYRLRRNDTLVKLARRYYAGDWEKWTLIRDANPGIKPKKLRVGRVFKIPVTVRRAGLRDDELTRIINHKRGMSQGRRAGAPFLYLPRRALTAPRSALSFLRSRRISGR